MNKHTLLIVGCGRIGTQLASMLGDDYIIYGMCRNPSRLPSNISGIEADVSQAQVVTKALAEKQFDYVLFSLSAGEYTQQAYENIYVGAVSNVIEALRGSEPKRIFFISSTRVYGSSEGAWLDESDEANPKDFAGKCLLAGEQSLVATRVPLTILRLSGLYGPRYGRLVESLRQGQLQLPEEDVYTNRIHSHDVAGFIGHLIAADTEGRAVESLYIVSDSEPTRYISLLTWLVQQLNVDMPTHEDGEGKTRTRKRYNRRFRNRRMLDSGYQLRYPDYRAGYQEILDRLESD